MPEVGQNQFGHRRLEGPVLAEAKQKNGSHRGCRSIPKGAEHLAIGKRVQFTRQTPSPVGPPPVAVIFGYGAIRTEATESFIGPPRLAGAVGEFQYAPIFPSIHAGVYLQGWSRHRNVQAEWKHQKWMTAMRVDAALVKQLIRSQFPQWAGLPVAPIGNGGWDNKTFRLGDKLLVRLPSAFRYVAQVEKEYLWLPQLGPRLPLPIPVPLGLGAPGPGYPWPWSIYRWLEGEQARTDRIHDLGQFAVDLANFLAALHGIDARDGPVAGAHNFHRGGSLAVYDAETRDSIETLANEIEVEAVREVWETALATSWRRPPVWVHGDVAAGNLLVKDGRLCGVIDFGCAGVGEPSCDLVIAWTFLDPASRVKFRAAIGLDAATWERGRGWAIWKALISLVQHRATNRTEADRALQVIRDVLADNSRTAP